jgi:hypothetical protein
MFLLDFKELEESAALDDFRIWSYGQHRPAVSGV